MNKIAKWNPQKVDTKVVKDFLVGQGTNLTDAQFTLFLGMAQANNLNPFKREIYAIPFQKWNPTTRQKEPSLTIVTGYQTYIERAEGTGKLDGWKVEVHNTAKGNISHATITIFRKDFKHPIEWTADISEFGKKNKEGSPQGIRAIMPKFMIKKVAIAQGFRLAFPTELGGMPYMEEEISSGSGDIIESEELNKEETKPPKELPRSEEKVITADQKKKANTVRGEFWKMSAEYKSDEKDKDGNAKFADSNKTPGRKAMIKAMFGQDSMTKLTADEGSRFIEKVEIKINELKNEFVNTEKTAAEKCKDKAKEMKKKKEDETEYKDEPPIEDKPKNLKDPLLVKAQELADIEKKQLLEGGVELDLHQYTDLVKEHYDRLINDEKTIKKANATLEKHIKKDDEDINDIFDGKKTTDDVMSDMKE